MKGWSRGHIPNYWTKTHLWLVLGSVSLGERAQEQPNGPSESPVLFLLLQVWSYLIFSVFSNAEVVTGRNRA